MEAAINANIEHEYAADVEELSLLEYDQEEGMEGDDLLFLDGYDQIVQAFATGLDLRLEHVVQSLNMTRVAWWCEPTRVISKPAGQS